MKISIVTTCLNADSTIKKTIESIHSQEGDFEIEHIITDAGSTDKTLEIIASLGAKIKLLDAKGLNQSEGINLGLKNATGDIQAFLNADDIYEPGTFQKVITSFENSPDKKWIIGKCRVIDEDDKEISLEQIMMRF